MEDKVSGFSYKLSGVGVEKYREKCQEFFDEFSKLDALYSNGKGDRELTNEFVKKFDSILKEHNYSFDVHNFGLLKMVEIQDCMDKMIIALANKGIAVCKSSAELVVKKRKADPEEEKKEEEDKIEEEEEEEEERDWKKMKMEDLKDYMKTKNIEIPLKGTGKAGRVIRRDLESSIRWSSLQREIF